MLENNRKKELKELKHSLEDLLGPHEFQMVLFGSRARGDFNEESDVDVAILVSKLTRETKHRILDRIAEIELKYLLPISAFIISEDEFSQLRKRERRIATEIESEGLAL